MDLHWVHDLVLVASLFERPPLASAANSQVGILPGTKWAQRKISRLVSASRKSDLVTGIVTKVPYLMVARSWQGRLVSGRPEPGTSRFSGDIAVGDRDPVVSIRKKRGHGHVDNCKDCNQESEWLMHPEGAELE
ncbi:hypothetical protein BCR41DRAFT_352614 [Lobosporangium transversale]|uniref:Uncharacterized protein n=1 Tax=Lobosporangium transversale TaxID=64571 RepID=A0A1Y2GP93_9FUNG|nr:hypothetical protein BCR41DRAFT_352614 [Lobosporangium transversale]ORZ17509.1 hypothetical protein BCR41DRAFT_352614 [Lobosporangium transversale]|eukprot:XP_021881896.1 hypothetical protein BCR41DRAFT_352614 [Lobosporangium transversale]